MKQYIETKIIEALASNGSYRIPDGILQNVGHDAIGSQALAFCGTSGVQMSWLASQTDMLADDWEIVESSVRGLLAAPGV